MEKSIYTREYAVLLQLLREKREGAGFTQQAVADGLGTTQTNISKCERGERRVDVIELREWCAVLGIDLHAFVNELERLLTSS